MWNRVQAALTKRHQAVPGVVRPPPRWADALPLAGALIGFAIALPGIFHTLRPAPTMVPADAAALVNQRPILMSDYAAQTEREAGEPLARATPAERARVLREMIDEELMVQRGLTLDLPENDTETRQALVHGLEAQVNAPVLAKPVTEAELRAFYAAHRADYASVGTMRVRNLVLHVGGIGDANQTAAQAMQDGAEAAYQLRAGVLAAAVMEHYGFVDAPKADTGPQFDFAARLHLGDTLYAVAAAMANGEVSNPVTLPDGVHLLVMDERQPPHVAEFAAARAAVMDGVRKARRDEAQAANVALLRRGADIVLAPGLAE